MLLEFIKSSNIKALRINDDGSIEYTTDNESWKVTSSSGHIIMDSTNTEFPQRTRLQFLNSVVSDENGITTIQGIKGDKGEPGQQGIKGQQRNSRKSRPRWQRWKNFFAILGLYESVEDLMEAHPVGDDGDAYAVGTSENNNIYIWDTDNSGGGQM